MHDLHNIPNAIEYLVGITGDKDHPHVGIVRTVTAVRMVAKLRECLPLHFSRHWQISHANTRVFVPDPRTREGCSVLSSFVAFVGLGN